MKGFVPVQKNNLLVMLANCLKAIDDDYLEKKAKVVSDYIEIEQRRSSVRRWFRLWILPQPRFAYHSSAVIEWSMKQDYDMFDGCPFKLLNMDRENSIRYILSLERIAKSSNAGEPIQLDIETFKRLDNPSNRHWVSTNILYTLK